LSLSVLSYQNQLTKTVQRNLDRKFSCWDNKNRKPQNDLNADERAVIPPTKTQAAVPDEALAHADEGAFPDCIEPRACE